MFIYTCHTDSLELTFLLCFPNISRSNHLFFIQVIKGDRGPTPQFSHDVELTLQEPNGRYAKDGSVMVIPKGTKTDILDTKIKD